MQIVKLETCKEETLITYPTSLIRTFLVSIMLKQTTTKVIREGRPQTREHH